MIIHLLLNNLFTILLQILEGIKYHLIFMLIIILEIYLILKKLTTSIMAQPLIFLKQILINLSILKVLPQLHILLWDVELIVRDVLLIYQIAVMNVLKMLNYLEEIVIEKMEYIYKCQSLNIQINF